MRVGPIMRGPYSMKTFAEGVLFATFPIEGDLIGTSFVVNHRWSDESSELGYFLVTNKHIIGDSKSGYLTMTVVGNDDSRTPHRFEVPRDLVAVASPS